MSKRINSADMQSNPKRGNRKVVPAVPRMKMVFRIIDSWGNKIIEEFAYKDLQLAEERLAELQQDDHKSYYLQPAKVLCQ